MSNQKLEMLIELLEQNKDRFTWKHRTILEAVIKKLKSKLFDDARSILIKVIRMETSGDFAEFAEKLEYKIQRIGEERRITIIIRTPAPNAELTIGEHIRNLYAEVTPIGAERGLAIDWILRGEDDKGNEIDRLVHEYSLIADISSRPVPSTIAPGSAILQIHLVDYGKPISKSMPVPVVLKRKESIFKVEITEVNQLSLQESALGEKFVKIPYDKQPIMVEGIVQGFGNKSFPWSLFSDETGQILDSGIINLTDIQKVKAFEFGLNRTFEPRNYHLLILLVQPDGSSKEERVNIEIESPPIIRVVIDPLPKTEYFTNETINLRAIISGLPKGREFKYIWYNLKGNESTYEQTSTSSVIEFPTQLTREGDYSIAMMIYDIPELPPGEKYIHSNSVDIIIKKQPEA